MPERETRRLNTKSDMIDNSINLSLLDSKSQTSTYHLQNFQLIHTLMDSVSLRVDAEEQYQNAIMKSLRKINDIQTNHPLFSKIVKSFKSLISERVHQIRFFKEQISKQAQLLKQSIKPVEQSMKQHLNELKIRQKQLKNDYECLCKTRNNAEQKLKQLDQKLILNQISILCKQSLAGRKISQIIIAQQQQINKIVNVQWQKLKLSLNNFEIKSQQKQKIIWELDVKFEQQFVDFFKKLNVHQISLIRNIQYDIDNMIKKTDIFNWQKDSQYKDKPKMKNNENIIINSIDIYSQYKKKIISSSQILIAKVQQSIDLEKLKVLKQIFQDRKQTQQFMPDIRKNYYQCRPQICQWIQHFRKEGNFKFQNQNYKIITYILKQLLKIAFYYQDFECINKIITYGNSYHTITAQNKKKTIFDQIKGDKILSQISFWKFYILWVIRYTISTCNSKQDRQVQIRSLIYSAMLSNSLTMIQCGLQKHQIKNWIGKVCKTFNTITQSQLGQLLKVIQSAYDNLQRAKKPKKQ